jgi:hypothetical protein
MFWVSSNGLPVYHDLKRAEFRLGLLVTVDTAFDRRCPKAMPNIPAFLDVWACAVGAFRVSGGGSFDDPFCLLYIWATGATLG